MKNDKRLKSWLVLGLLLVGTSLISWLFLPSSSIRANPATNELEVTAKQLILSQNEEFPDLTTESGLETLFKKESLPAATKDFSYEYSNEKGKTKKASSTKVGYQQLYVKMTNKRTKKSNVIPVPATIKSAGTTLLAENQIALQLDSEEEYIQFQAKDVENKTAEELQQLVTEKTNARAWRTDTGKELPVTVSKTTIDPAVVGNYHATFDIALDGQKQAIQAEKDIVIQENTKMLNPSPETRTEEDDPWILIPFGTYAYTQNTFKKGVFRMKNETSSYTSISLNTLNYLKYESGQIAYKIDDGVGSLFNRMVGGMYTMVPIIDGELQRTLANEYRPKVYANADKTKMKAETSNAEYKITFEMNIAPNQSYRVQTRIENLTSTNRSMGFLNKGMVSTAGISFAKDYYLTSLGNGRGFRGQFTKNEAQEQTYFAIDFKPRVSDPYTYWNVKPQSGFKDEDWIALHENAMKPGLENNKLSSGEKFFDKAEGGYYFSAGVPEKDIAPGESVSATWDLFFGESLPYLTINPTPNEYNVYQDTAEQEFNYDYEIGRIPQDGGGTLYITYPDDSEEKKPFTVTETTGKVTVPRAKLPQQLNDHPGTIKNYVTNLLAINEVGMWADLPSEDTYLNLNVYNLGATPIAQFVKKDSAWNKTAKSLVKDPIILPNHEASYQYVNEKEPIDTSKVGMHMVEVRMTDETEGKGRSTIIKVPVMVTDGVIPDNGLFLGVNNFSVDKSELTGLSKDQLKNLILDKSKAAAWDVATGSSEGVDLLVFNTTLTNESEASTTPYTAKLQAKKDDEVIEETVYITVTAKSKLTVQFVDEDNNAIELPVTLNKNAGDTVNLREDAEIKALLNKQKGLGYEEIATPKNDTNYPIAKKDESVTYQFKTKSKLTVEFVNEKNAVLNTVELTKQIGSKVDLTKETDVLAVLDPLKAKYPLLSSPAKETDYEMANNDAQKVTYQFKTEAKLTVQFVDENNKILDSKDTVELQKEIGVPVDLTQEKTIQDIVNKYKGMNYVLLESPTPENAYPIMADDQTITYKFQTNSKLIINFVNEKNEQLKTLELDKEVGKPVNLSKEQSIVDTLAELDKENHVLEKRPDNEANYPVGATNAPVTYYFRSYATLVVEFLNASISNEDVLREPLRLEKRIGTVFDFIEDSEIATIIDGFMDKGYGIAGYRPESPYTITRDAEQQIEFQIALDGEIPVEFVDEKNTIIKKFEMVRDIGKLDLSEDRDILDAIKELQAQNYEVIERPVNEKTYQVKMHNDKVVYKVKKTEVALKIRFVDEEGKDIPSVESINSTAIIGSTLDLTQYETEIQERLTQLKDEHYKLVESPVDNQEIKGPLELFYRFKGSLFISSYPETLDFRDKYMTSKVIQAEQPRYDKDLIVKDTRKNNKGAWQLSATLETPLTSKENPSEIINNVFFYKQNATTKVPLLTGQAQPIETGVATTVEEEYNISKKWTENKTGLELIVHSNKIFQTGKYGASILWQVESTP